MRSGSLLTLCLLLVTLSAPVRAFDCTSEAPHWSETTPPVNLTHLFCGEINRRGDAVGFHATLGEATPGEAEIDKVLRPRDAHGIYVARVCQPNAPGRQCKRSTLFPDDLDGEEILAAVLEAYHQRQWLDGRGKWCGNSGLGYAIEGWLLPHREVINTAWPAARGC
ncbi:EndoU domain-containing protein [Aquibaculum arenosum]|uniref:EndoU domain-containing protein n=1 Tax=Aquibaculum arenosum TaxID=3032591 RepID=A0ABT5YI09_9PROT|nr:EndoU domain-containing protein [Fodinicurvata sp. CAU 1616]MDF2094576.1 EndoU domain-containing protein [Fodinicurvata sp. CAU 1616]